MINTSGCASGMTSHEVTNSSAQSIYIYFCWSLITHVRPIYMGARYTLAVYMGHTAEKHSKQCLFCTACKFRPYIWVTGMHCPHIWVVSYVRAICTGVKMHPYTTTPHHNHFTALFQGPPWWAGARKELLDFMVQGKINRGRHTDHQAVRHAIRTKQCPPPPSPIFLQTWCHSCRPTNSVKALKATSAFGLGRRR